MQWWCRAQYFFMAVALHMVLLLALLWLPMTPSMPTVTQVADVAPVKAVMVDAGAVEAAMKRIKTTQQQAEKRAKKQRDQWQRAALAAKKKRLIEQRRLQQLQKKQRHLDQQVAVATQQQAKASRQLQQTEQKLKTLSTQAKQQQAAQQQAAQQQAKARQLALQKAKAQTQLLAQQNEMNRYKAMIVEKIAQYWVVPKQFKADVSCRLLIQLNTAGEVLNAKILQGSGFPVLDASARAAVLKASPLPVPHDPALFNQFKVLRLTVRPEQLRHL